MDYKNTSVMAAIYSEDRELVKQEVKAAIRQNRNAAVDIRILYGESEYKPFHVTANILPKGDGNYLLYVFKTINDTLGHSIGDMVLKELSNNISSILRKDDIIGRMGGDEFFVFLKSIPNKQIAASKAKQICQLDIKVKGLHAPVTVSVGIALAPQNGNDFDTLYKKVDAALYKQKEQGKNGYAFVAD